MSKTWLVALTLAVAVGSLPPGGTFVDDDGNVHEASIEAVAAAGITRGCNPPSNQLFCPDGVVTRGQMAAFLTRALDIRSDTGPDRFVDDQGTTFETAINAIAAAGITRGCNPPVNDRFCPERTMNRAEMAAMLVRAFEFPQGERDRFVDDDDNIFETAIDAIASAGVTVGCNPPLNDRYCPEEPVTRAEMATFLTRAIPELEPMQPPPRPHPAVTVVSRETWGARPPETGRMIAHTIERLTIHHAGTQSGTTGPPQFRGWQNWHMSGQDWPDIAYHLLIGVDGTVYEGRNPMYQGDTGTTYDTSGHFLVVVEGNFDYEHPTTAQLDSLIRVLSWAVGHYQVSPATISGHRDHAGTSCPGHNLAALIDSGAIEQQVRDTVDTGGVDLIWG